MVGSGEGCLLQAILLQVWSRPFNYIEKWRFSTLHVGDGEHDVALWLRGHRLVHLVHFVLRYGARGCLSFLPNIWNTYHQRRPGWLQLGARAPQGYRNW